VDFRLTKEQDMLKSTALEFFKKECSTSLMREMRDQEKGYRSDLWKKMADLGWLGVVIPEKYGGVGGDFLDLCILLECMGGQCVPSPYFPTVVLGGLSILLWGSEEQKEDLLPRVASGELNLALAIFEPGHEQSLGGVTTRARQGKGGYILEGTKLFVENAHIADYVLCIARTDRKLPANKALSLFLVDGKSPRIQSTVMGNLAYEKQCEVVFDKVKVPWENMIGEKGAGWEMADHLLECAAVAKCAEMLGGLQATLDMSVSYAKAREQFGRPIGSFQAIQHHCANMKSDVDSCRIVTYKAAWKIASGLPVPMDAAVAKAWTNFASRRVTLLGHQVHGGVSFCEEHDMHLYYRKAKAGALSLCDNDYVLEKVARQLDL
jgi:3-oxocholest-4-en-26-oyl-CoA dehydrogenase beta subunit